jgi:hypothetical protein
MGLHLWQYPHALDALNGVGLVQFSKLVLIELEQGLILLVVTDILRGLWLRGGLPRWFWLDGGLPWLCHGMQVNTRNVNQGIKK